MSLIDPPDSPELNEVNISAVNNYTLLCAWCKSNEKFIRKHNFKQVLLQASEDLELPISQNTLLQACELMLALKPNPTYQCPWIEANETELSLIGKRLSALEHHCGILDKCEDNFVLSEYRT